MKILGIIGLVIVALVGFWLTKYPIGTWHYKMTVAIQTPEGVKTGSAVREVYVKSGPGLFTDSTPKVTIKGEAVVIDLGPRGLIFALLRGDKMGVDYGQNVFLRTIGPNEGAGSTTPEGVRYFNSLPVGTSLDLTDNAQRLPMLVRFKDINDPKSVERVDPSNLAAIYGEGVSLKSVTIEITDEPITTGIEKYLSWLGGYYDKMFDGQRFEIATATNRFANSTNSGDFSTRGAK